MSEVPKGRFVWYDLMTTDTGAAVDFYSAVAGWGTDDWKGPAEGMPPYKMWTANGKPLGGLMELPEQAKQGGAPPHWLAYIAVADVDATVTRAKELGGAVYMEAKDIPTVGRFAVLADPAGGVFAAFKPENDSPGTDGPPPVGEFSWHELLTNDYEAAFSFYADLFGWDKGEAMDMGEAGIYQLFARGGSEMPLGGIMNKPPEMPAGAWNYYVRVDDLDAALGRVSGNGGTVIYGPMEVPGGDRVATCQDPQGAVFSLHYVAAQA